MVGHLNILPLVFLTAIADRAPVPAVPGAEAFATTPLQGRTSPECDASIGAVHEEQTSLRPVVSVAGIGMPLPIALPSTQLLPKCDVIRVS